ncbi:sugar kinase [Pannus brasiliensis CCIBt3594]|uniref:Sugar kinase n=1 Tax=Pannus brasiliensis CCIBt3594 TaxID=1427578 RepID=A0AAW9QUS5_9CHRO
MKQGLFIGLTTLDWIYRTERYPGANEKVVAIEQTIAAGGPATNAAVAFAGLGGKSLVYSALGQHPITGLIREDLEKHQVISRDLRPDWSEIPPISSITVTETTGERAVISLNATRARADLRYLPEEPLQNIDIVLVDGHQIVVGEAIARQARERGIPVAIDGGSWKEGFEKILPFVDYSIVSADFYPPSCSDKEDVFAYLEDFRIPYIAITDGERAIEYSALGERGAIEVNPVRAIDTLGAGDIFHGAFCYFILQTDFPSALQKASEVAALSCQFFGTRRWLEKRPASSIE